MEISEEKRKYGHNRGTPRRCKHCGSEAPLVWVHGHGQCAACGINVQECCQGEQCERTERTLTKE